MSLPIVIIKSLAAANATTIAASQSPATSALTINGSLAVSGLATLDSQRRVVLASGGNDSAVTFTVVGTNENGNPITDSFLGANTSTVQSNLDFLTVKSITPSASVASTITAGTGNAGSSQWRIMNLGVSPFNCELSCVPTTTGAVNFTAQYTYDDPNNLPSGVAFPTAFSHPTVTGTASIDGSLLSPVFATRLLINSGTGTVRMTILQAGIAGP